MYPIIKITNVMADLKTPQEKELQLRNCLYKWLMRMSISPIDGEPSPLWVVSSLDRQAWTI